jgi:hypothetical protein
MNRKELIDALATKTGSTKADADRNFAAIIDIITVTLKKGDNFLWWVLVRLKCVSVLHAQAAILRLEQH